MTRAFLTDAHSDHASWLREQFRHFPDEFVLSNLGHRAREASSPGLRSEVMGMKTQIASLKEVVKSIAGVTERIMERRLGDTGDLADVRDSLSCHGQILKLKNTYGYQTAPKLSILNSINEFANGMGVCKILFLVWNGLQGLIGIFVEIRRVIWFPITVVRIFSGIDESKKSDKNC